VALWCSSAANYLGSSDIRPTITFLATLAAGFKAYCSVGRWRCFWFGFFAVLFLYWIETGNGGPGLHWIAFLFRRKFSPVTATGWDQPAGLTSESAIEFAIETVQFAMFAVLATIAGYIGLTIYDHSQK
jgi:hypothetical protein